MRQPFLTARGDRDSFLYSRLRESDHWRRLGAIMLGTSNLALAADLTKHEFTGGLAQLGERLAGSQKVRGSNPLSSNF
jgi:hypothetical protein